MDEQKPDISQKTSIDDLMIAEFNRTSALFLDNEQLGERRLQIFITLVSAVTALLGLTNFIPGSKDKIVIYYFGLFALGVLLVFGIVTLKRIIHRNVITDTYKYLLDAIRIYFIKEKRSDKDTILNWIWPFQSSLGRREEIEEIERMERRSSKVGWHLGYGGISETVQILNDYLIGLIGVLSFVLVWSPNTSTVNLIQLGYSIVVFVGLFLFTHWVQISRTRLWYKDEEKKQESRHRVKYEIEEGKK